MGRGGQSKDPGPVVVYTDLPDGSAPRKAVDANVWFIHGVAYDLTKGDWLEKHPGGRYILDITRGTDCTELFESYHAASLKGIFITAKLATCKAAGTGTGKDGRAYDVPVPGKAYDWDDTPIYTDVKKVVREYRRQYGIKATDRPTAVAWYAIWGVVHYVTFARWLCGDSTMSNLVLFGMSIWFFCGDLMHNGTHYSLTYGSAAGEMVAWVCGFLFIIPSAWVRQHVTGHHVHTNAHQHDPDLYHFHKFFKCNADGNEVTGSAHLAMAPVTPLFTHISPSLRGGWELLNKGRWDGVEEVVVWAKNEEAVTWLTWLVLMAGLFVSVWLNGILHVVVPSIVTAGFYYCFSQVSHINAASFQTPATREWACMQITTTQGDYSYDSWFWNKLSNGLHNQTLHHLIPSVHSTHYPALSVLLEPVFAKHHMPMPGWKHSYRDAFRLHVEHLSTLNKWDAIAAVISMD